jgi:hypothetical protein
MVGDLFELKNKVVNMRALKTCRGRSGRFPLILKVGLAMINHTAMYLEEMRDLSY